MENERELAEVSDSLQSRTPDHKLVARMLIREGKSFKESALAGGYSASVAATGLKRLLAASGPFADAYQHETVTVANSKLNSLKPLVIRRLEASILNLKSADGMKACELAGRFKETDWWVKSSADVQIGILAGLSVESAPPAEPYKDDE
jgi:hypothetical protein